MRRPQIRCCPSQQLSLKCQRLMQFALRIASWRFRAPSAPLFHLHAKLASFQLIRSDRCQNVHPGASFSGLRQIGMHRVLSPNPFECLDTHLRYSALPDALESRRLHQYSSICVSGESRCITFMLTLNIH